MTRAEQLQLRRPPHQAARCAGSQRNGVRSGQVREYGCLWTDTCNSWMHGFLQTALVASAVQQTMGTIPEVGPEDAVQAGVASSSASSIAAKSREEVVVALATNVTPEVWEGCLAVVKRVSHYWAWTTAVWADRERSTHYCWLAPVRFHELNHGYTTALHTAKEWGG